jgi:predicted RNA-binding protein with PIN domain
VTEPSGGQDAGTGPALLPEPVRIRALAFAADALGEITADQLPAPLRRVASFAPARRARLAGTQIAAALESDEAFRERVATRVRLAVPDLASALDDNALPPAADPVQTAAVAYLLRSAGWTDLVDAAREAGQVNAEPADRSPGTVERLQQKLRDARSQLRAVQTKAKDQVAAVKRENAELRRKLADVRQRLAAAERSVQEAGAAQESAQKETAALESEARRLRARIGELEASQSAARRSVRDERESASVRARLLLDTLLELRRELALPPVSGSPADTVEGAVDSGRSTAWGTGMALSADDPALLDELLALPRVHVIIDGYNVTKTAWSSAPLESQRSRLLNGLAPLVARNRAEMTVVFDGAELKERPPVGGPRGVRVMFSPPGVIADDVIRHLVEAEPPGRPVVVVSSDREVAAAAYRGGARSVEATALVRLLGR